MCEGIDTPLDFSSVAQADGAHFSSKRWCNGLSGSQKSGSRGKSRILEHSYARNAWCNLFEKLKPFSPNAKVKNCKAGRITAGPSEAIHEASADWVGGLHEHDRCRRGQLLQRPNLRRAHRENYVGVQCKQLHCSPPN